MEQQTELNVQECDQQWTDEDIVTYFNTCDKDHDGVVSVANLIETLEQLRFPQETIDYTVNMIQFDENGTIELEAFMECARKVAKGEVPNNEGTCFLVSNYTPPYFLAYNLR
eukprot:TRINITY_DN5402_c0_g1_i1.p1 TRINITY_DN5402_c0_g1~~TRINITY_DN5402_c0_g1_i1.p1  ORF type:complete len:112 (-),score=17.77 TRINITY_DN5402_c0_g1_i1:524-859(-)